MNQYNEPEEDLYLLNASSLPKKRNPKLQPNSYRYQFATGSILLFFLAIMHIKAGKQALNLNSEKVLTPEKIIEAQEATRASREKLAQSYLPAADYEDPCDEARVDCCIDSSFPVLGGLDVVSFHLDGTIVFGDPKFSSEIKVDHTRSYRFWFSEPAFVSLFETNPQSYLPKWGGFNAEKFCAGEGDFLTLISKTVELSEVKGFLGHAAFGNVPAQDVNICDDKFETLFDKPSMDVFNTRCVSMSHFATDVSGLLPTMPPLSRPMKMSQLKNEIQNSVAKLFV